MHSITTTEKKVILFVVEGQTDEDSLAMTLRRLLKDDKVFFHAIRKYNTFSIASKNN